MDICRVTQEELANDETQESESMRFVRRADAINDRTEEIMGGCSLPDSANRGLLVEAIIDDSEILKEITDIAWLFKPYEEVDKLPMSEVRHMTLKMQVIANKLHRLAQDIATNEVDDA